MKESIIGIHEDAKEASVRVYWRKSHDLLTTSNRADARLQLKHICSELVEFRHAQIRESVLTFCFAAENAKNLKASAPWMNRCLKSLDRLKDAIVLESFIRTALGEVSFFVTQVIPSEQEDLRIAFLQYREATNAALKGLFRKERVRLFLRTAPMRLIAYKRLLDFICLSTDTPPKAVLPGDIVAATIDAPHVTANQNSRISASGLPGEMH